MKGYRDTLRADIRFVYWENAFGESQQVQAGNLQQARESQIFLFGHCHSWALAAHEETGLDIISFRGPKIQHGWIRHFAVQGFDKRFIVDINGITLTRKLKRETGWIFETVGNAEQMKHAMVDSETRWNRVWKPLNTRGALPFVQAVFDEVSGF